MNLKPRRHDEVDITLISFIDVVLVLIVFFMLSSEFVNEGRVRVHLPQAAGAPPAAKQQVEPLVVTVTQSGSYRVNEQDLINSSPETLRAALVKVAGQDRTMRVTLRADGARHSSVRHHGDGRAGPPRVQRDQRSHGQGSPGGAALSDKQPRHFASARCARGLPPPVPVREASLEDVRHRRAGRRAVLGYERRHALRHPEVAERRVRDATTPPLCGSCRSRSS